jgi:AcrR family transcriptional regulator
MSERELGVKMPKVIDNEYVYQAVMQVVLERGYIGATTKQMAEAAGISEVTLFRKYVSKPELVRQAILWLMEKIDFTAIVRYTGNVEVDLMRMVQTYQDTAVQHGPFFAVILSEVPRNPELANIIAEPIKIFSSMADLLARYQQEGVLKSEHPLHALAALLGPLMYSSLIRGAVSDTPIPALDLANHVNCYLDGRRA